MLFDIHSFLDGFSAPTPKSADAENLFSDRRRAWHELKTAEARCDFAPDRFRLNARGIMFISLWRRSIYGRTLTEIKNDDSMVPYFADSMAPFITRILGESLAHSGWAVGTPPPRRHIENNFAARVASLLADRLAIPYRGGIARAKNRQRVNAEFELLYDPPEKNLIIFDDIVTTGSTFIAMDKILRPLSKTILYVTAINNK
ncbi:MAG: phosphoribosyltransferase [Muribaculaceae bacterium]|nr:phosphoribosyltransferase [Muribaculaceae bacterium]